VVRPRTKARFLYLLSSLAGFVIEGLEAPSITGTGLSIFSLVGTPLMLKRLKSCLEVMQNYGCNANMDASCMQHAPLNGDVSGSYVMTHLEISLTLKVLSY